MDAQQFQKIGLSKNEAEVYLMLCQLGAVPASVVAKKLSISRPYVYDALNKLVEKGFAAYVTKNGKRHFRAADPGRIVQFIQEEKARLDEQEKEFSEMIPRLRKLSLSQEESKIDVFEGGMGIRYILEDMIEQGAEILAFNTLGKELLEYIPAYVLKRYFAGRKEKKIPSRQFYVPGAQIIKHEWGRYKALPSSFTPVSFFVYGDTVVNIILSKKSLTIKIKSKEIATLYRNQFEYLWKNTPS